MERRFTVMSREWCHLCHDLVDALRPLAEAAGWDVEVIDVELWYLDQDELTHAQKPTTKWIRHLKPFDARFKRMSAAKTFKPAANKISCRWCPYREGICPHAVK